MNLLWLGADQRVIDQRVGHSAPENEAADGSDVSAALSPFEDEVPRSLLQKLIQEHGRRDVQIGSDPRVLEFFRLIRAAARDDRERGLAVAHRGALILQDLRGHETQETDTPRPVSEPLTGLPKERTDGIALHQRHGNHRQPTVGRDGLDELRPIAHVRHRALNDGQPRPMGLGQWCSRSENVEFQRPAGPPQFLGFNGSQRSRDRAELLRPRDANGRVLAQRRDEVAPDPGVPTDAVQERSQVVVVLDPPLLQFPCVVSARHRPDAQVSARLPSVDQDRLLPGKETQLGGQILPQRRFPQQQQLIIQNHARGPAQFYRRGRVDVYATADEDR